ncbi:protein translocase subunit SecD [Persicirhabdus sediminis]|uniref:Multifunctional fusion protein n=1 Tax=Persicirhabdus sediminis TaxID=454144 RepID=A0A8J7M9Z6_9BACT|nr:protein translocase subunit SecD [Persicirhabdus sediminis]MBK1789654.1 protein translocase subunit SecD [Persicirhabdus sediminis]
MTIANTFSGDGLMIFLSGLLLLGLFFWYFATEIQKRKRNLGTIIVAMIAVFSIFAVIPPTSSQMGDLFSGKKSFNEASSLKGGIDLVGGSSFTLRVQPNTDEAGKPVPLTADAVTQAILTIEKRLNSMGTEDLIIQQQGADRIIVQMPGVEPGRAEEIRTVLEQVAKLEIRLVHEESSTLAPEVAADPETNIIPGYKLYQYKNTDRDGRAITEDLLLRNRIVIDGSYITRAQALYGADAGQIAVELNGEGGDLMFATTRAANIGHTRMAIVLDGEVLSAPSINGVFGSLFQISGMDSIEEAQALSSALMNPLKNPLQVDEMRSVSASLGASTVSQGIYAGIAGLLLTMIFVLIYYRFAGVIALLGLTLNVIILFGAMALFGFTFTLPGIAGIILTIGIAVDANVLIYERLREELANGKSLKNAIEVAYEKAFSAIFDANITTLITACILFWRASGTVKGFAVTLTIGIIASMIAALLFTRVLFWWAADAKLLKDKMTFLNVIPKRKFDFLSKRRIAAMISGVLLLGSVCGVGVKGNSALGIDFTGGTIIHFDLGEDHILAEEAQSKLNALELTQSVTALEETTNVGLNILSVRCATADTDKVIEFMQANYDEIATDHQPDQDTVSATMGREFLITALSALGIGLIAILIYITLRFEFSFALGACAALFHDLVITLGIIVLTGGELTLIHVGAFLTIAGYSINDTIVVFDRIREELRNQEDGGIKDVMNFAINATLSRTVLTSFTTFVAVLVLFIFGGEGLRDFSYTIMIGVLIGTYSSIFIAAPVVYVWSRRKGGDLRAEITKHDDDDELEGIEKEVPEKA